MESAKNSISFIIPAYNEEEGVGQTIQDIEKAIKDIGLEYEIIVIDDGSKDRTASIVERFENVRLIRHPINVGYGNALKTGILNARFDWICMTDADATYAVADLPRLILEMDKGFDMVVAQRANLSEHDRFVKRIMRKIYIKIIEVVITRYDVGDPNSGFRIFKRGLALEFLNFLCGTFSFTTSLTILALEKPCFVKYVPVQYATRKGQSKVRHFRDTLRTLQLIIQGMTYYNPIKFFIILSLLMGVFVVFPAMIFALFKAYTLSLCYMIFGCTSALLFGIGVLADVIRVSAQKLKLCQNCTRFQTSYKSERYTT